MNYLSDTQLLNLALSIFSRVPHSKTSEKYQVIPTIDCINALKDNGFYPVKAMENRTRSQDNAPFVKHLIRFRREGMFNVGGNVPEIVMTNSHNGLSSYQLSAGIYRLVCSNGLVVGNNFFCRRVRHQGDVVDKVVESANDIIEIMPLAIEKAEEWKGVNLSKEAQLIFAESAAGLKYDKEDNEIPTEILLRPRRQADTSPDLWTTFNVVQENLIKGGVRFYNSKTHQRSSIRGVNSVSENSRLNTALWSLTEKMYELTK